MPWFVAELAYVYAVAGKRREALETMRGLQELARTRHVSAYMHAQGYIGLGDPQRSMEWLQKAYEERSSLLTEFCDPLFDPLREQPRFRELLRRMNAPQKWMSAHTVAPTSSRAAVAWR